MRKIYYVEISCSNCPHMHWVGGERFCCLESRRIATAVSQFPSWCPLEEATQQDDTADADNSCVHGVLNGHYCSHCRRTVGR
jgi:hypothetical protein